MPINACYLLLTTISSAIQIYLLHMKNVRCSLLLIFTILCYYCPCTICRW